MTEEISIEVEGKHISGHYVVRDGMVTVTASDGRTTKGVIEDSMLSAETLAKTGREMRELRRHQRENAQSPFVFVSERGAPRSAPGSVQGIFPQLIYVARVCFEIKSRPVRAVGN